MSTSERMELHFARRWVARVVLVSGVVGFSWSSLVVGIVVVVVDGGGGLGWGCTPNHGSLGLWLSFEEKGRFRYKIQRSVYIVL